jgi:hypothetical protein
MSIQIQGTLSIKAVNGRSGSFCVGDLITDIGSFKVKDAILDQYPAGDYEGSFVIDEIYPSSYTWRGKVWVEVRAKLSSIHVDSEPETPDPDSLPETVEPDPADEERPGPPRLELVESAQADAEAAPSATSLFDRETQGLIDTGKPVKLDPTVDRGVFRAQRDALKALGYRFDASKQTWELPAV